MTQHLFRDLELLKQDILFMGGLVEAAINNSISALVNRDSGLAEEVLRKEETIDKKELDIGEECLKILALHQPVAGDLRFIVAVMMVNNDLERIGDLALNIAERAVLLSELPPCEIPFDFQGMAEKVKHMLRTSLDALMELDPNLASDVCRADDEVDAINRGMYLMVAKGMRENPDQIETLMLMLGISRLLERIADHTTNIAEDVIYMIEGEIVRHRAEDYVPQSGQPRSNRP